VVLSCKPRVSIAMNGFWAAALLAASGDATPSMGHFPNREGSFAIFFYSMYVAKEESAGPVPGRTPKIAPTNVPRTVGHEASFRSLAAGIRLAILPVKT